MKPIPRDPPVINTFLPDTENNDEIILVLPLLHVFVLLLFILFATVVVVDVVVVVE